MKRHGLGKTLHYEFKVLNRNEENENENIINEMKSPV